jgi:hypothetical protein
MPTILSDLERQVRARLKELEPLVEEAAQLKRLLASFEQAQTASPPRATSPRRGAQPKKRARRGRPAGSSTGSRAAEALRLVGERPGITVAELAESMGIGPTYLYRVMPSLERDGKVRKAGKGYELAAARSSRKR